MNYTLITQMFASLSDTLKYYALQLEDPASTTEEAVAAASDDGAGEEGDVYYEDDDAFVDVISALEGLQPEPIGE